MNFSESSRNRICVKFGQSPAVALSGSPDLLFDPPAHSHFSRIKAFLLEQLDKDKTIYFHDLSSQTWKKVKINRLEDDNYIEFEDYNEAAIKYPLKTYMEFKKESPVTPPAISYTSSELDAISKSFSAKLTYSGKVQNTLITEYLCRSATIVKGGGFMLPTRSCVKPVGSGKAEVLVNQAGD